MPWHSDALARFCSFQVRRALRRHHIKPHWMFALDDAVSRAVQAAFTVLVRGGWHWGMAWMWGLGPTTVARWVEEEGGWPGGLWGAGKQI